jgi:hypothetical protein
VRPAARQPLEKLVGQRAAPGVHTRDPHNDAPTIPRSAPTADRYRWMDRP